MDTPELIPILVVASLWSAGKEKKAVSSGITLTGRLSRPAEAADLELAQVKVAFDPSSWVGGRAIGWQCGKPCEKVSHADSVNFLEKPLLALACQG